MENGRFDPITLEVLWSRLVAVADESATTLLRTAFSTIIRESNDYATCLMNVRGETLAECSGGIPTFAGLIGRTCRNFLTRFPVESWREGDCIITNDPWLGTGHLPDILMISPVFFNNRLVGFSGTAAHTPDVGGTLGPMNKEIFEEGIRIPPMHLFRKGILNEDLADIFRANVRLPEIVMGDLEAQATANKVCSRGALSFLQDTGLTDFVDLSAEIQSLSESAMRTAIRRIPDGAYRSEVSIDGFADQPTTIRCAIKVEGDGIEIDYAGTSPQINLGINCTLNYTSAYTIYPLKCVLDPHTRRNEGSYRPIKVTAPEGCILNATFPSPVSSRNLTGHVASCALYQALAQVIPDAVMADSGGAPAMRVRFDGRRDDGSRYSTILFVSAGMGASSSADGLSTTAFPTNSGAGSLEAIEAVSPLLFKRKEFRTDSGGSGKYRGGLGQICEVVNRSKFPGQVLIQGDRERHPALGLLGGEPGAVAKADIDGRAVPLKSKNVFNTGSAVSLYFAGGGGFGNPRERDPDAIKLDLKEGKISQQAAATYGQQAKQ
jgi:N-methylhydantoinase B